MPCHPVVPLVSNQFTFLVPPFGVLLWLPLAFLQGLVVCSAEMQGEMYLNHLVLIGCLNVQFFTLKLIYL